MTILAQVGARRKHMLHRLPDYELKSTILKTGKTPKCVHSLAGCLVKGRAGNKSPFQELGTLLAASFKLEPAVQ
jgi:hypothetical protein